ncbi:TIGR04222 domain-containing membrane protein [Nonomuraea typhae]|uniref:TIGR04222 domain-containing membrane protein n=1 Tax=Nonomuraea typhae TaxID=2603600 RepID=UPI003CCDF10C
MREAELHHYEVAYLAGGPARVADTAIGLLAGAGEVRVSRGGLLRHVRTAVSSGFPAEDKVLALLAETPKSGHAVRDVRAHVAAAPATAEIKVRLAGWACWSTPSQGRASACAGSCCATWSSSRSAAWRPTWSC